MIYNFALTHNDLDALGCTLVLRSKLKTRDEELCCLQRTNYKDLSDKIDFLLKNANRIIKLHTSKKNDVYSVPEINLYIMDVSFSQHKDLLMELCKCFTHVTFIDHHMYPEKFFEDVCKECANISINVKQDRCATVLTYEEGKLDFNDVQKSPFTLEHLVSLINDYDMWKTDSISFDSAFWLNEYFKSEDENFAFPEIIEDFEELDLSERLKVKGWTLNYYDCVEQYLMLKTKNDVEKIVANDKLYHVENDVTFLNTFDCFQHFVYTEMLKGQNIVTATDADNTRVKVRIKPNVYTSASLNEFRKALTGFENFGHPLAFSYQGDFSKLKDNLKLLVKMYVS